MYTSLSCNLLARALDGPFKLGIMPKLLIWLDDWSNLASNVRINILIVVMTSWIGQIWLMSSKYPNSQHDQPNLDNHPNSLDDLQKWSNWSWCQISVESEWFLLSRSLLRWSTKLVLFGWWCHDQGCPSATLTWSIFACIALYVALKLKGSIGTFISPGPLG